MAKISIIDLNSSTPDLRDLAEGELKLTFGGEEINPRLRHVYDDKKEKKNKKDKDKD